jgi:NAD(P)-dependent dehydrogenase (short-subunit alcohol dehydrogenase family)
MNSPKFIEDNSMEGRICLVTGASRGIGFQTALGLASKGAFVVLASHNRQRGKKASRRINAYIMRKVTDFMLVDLSSQEQIREFTETFKEKYDRLDVLVNNAGGFFLKYRKSVDGIEMTFALNHLNYFMTTLLLMDPILASGSGPIVNVSAESHRGHVMNFDGLQFESGYNGFQAYGQSKLANLLFTYELARRLANPEVTVNALHPGFVKTHLGKQNRVVWAVMNVLHIFAKSPKEGAETPIYLASSPDVAGVSGQYFIDKKEVPSSPESYDPVTAERLWNVSEELCGLGASPVRSGDLQIAGSRLNEVMGT